MYNNSNEDYDQKSVPNSSMLSKLRKIEWDKLDATCFKFHHDELLLEVCIYISTINPKNKNSQTIHVFNKYRVYLKKKKKAQQ